MEAPVACRFLVKVQVNLGDYGREPHLVYDQKRSLTAFVEPRQQPTYETLYKKVRSEGWMGAKAYMWCTRDSETALRIYLEGMPEQMPLW